MAKKKAQKNKPKGKPNGHLKRSKGPRQPALPGMEDRAITELQDAALSYAEDRDKRMVLTKREVESKSLVLGIMKKHGKTHYAHGNVIVDLVPEDVKVKVTILAEGEEAPAPKSKQTDFTTDQMAGEESAPQPD